MSNLLNNRVNTTATPAQMTAVKAAFQTILTNMPFLVSLTADERKTLTSIDVSNKAFVEDAINAGVNNPIMVPAYTSMTNVQNDLTLFSQMDEISGIINQLQERIDDTRMAAGSEAYAASLNLYKAFVNAADGGAHGADSIVTKLKKRFPSGGNTPKEAPTPPISQE